MSSTDSLASADLKLSSRMARAYVGRGSFGLLFAFCFSILIFVHQKHFNTASAVSRLDLLLALLSKQSFQIDSYHENTPDKAFFDEHYYSDKAPGTAALALPAFSIALAIWCPAEPVFDCKTGWLFSSWFACAGSIAILTALGAAALFS
jgi:hypothetical protein